MPPEEKNNLDLLERFTKAVEAGSKAPMTAMEIKVMISLLREQIATLEAKKDRIIVSSNEQTVALRAERAKKSASLKEELDIFDEPKMKMALRKEIVRVHDEINAKIATLDSSKEIAKLDKTIEQCETAIQRLLTQ